MYTCPICSQMILEGQDCTNPLCFWDSCNRRFGKIYIIGYDVGELHDAVRAKLKNDKSALGELSLALTKYLRDNREKFAGQYGLIIPVPTYPDAVSRRGFDAVSEICRQASEQLPSGFSKLFGQQGLLIKTRDTTETKTKTTYQERRDNLAGAFSIHPALSETFAKKYAGKRVLVVDDVFTTGSTINECAKVLLEVGVKQVDGLVVVRASLR